MKKIPFRYILEFFLYHLLFPFALFIYGNRGIFIISEKGNDARDNGFHMFKYMRENHPERRVYYIINENSPDRHKVEKYGNIVKYGSLKHYLLFIGADYKLSTHIMGFSPNMFFYKNYCKAIHFHGKIILLKHGITKDDLECIHAENTKLDILICGSKSEYEYISNTFHYTNGQVKYTGLARFDSLNNNSTKNQILIMPTWRKYLPEKEIEDCEYVSVWNSLLNNPQFIKILDDYDLTAVFYPHHNIQPYLHYFSSPSSRLVIADYEHYDVQTLLMESKLLITDYSSVFFDFAYMLKPCLYYQFDAEKFFKYHYKKGYFDYESNGFGEVLFQENDLILAIENIVQSGFKISEIHEKRMQTFFPVKDHDNCKRIYNEICQL